MSFQWNIAEIQDIRNNDPVVKEILYRFANDENFKLANEATFKIQYDELTNYFNWQMPSMNNPGKMLEYNDTLAYIQTVACRVSSIKACFIGFDYHLKKYLSLIKLHSPSIPFIKKYKTKDMQKEVVRHIFFEIYTLIDKIEYLKKLCDMITTTTDQASFNSAYQRKNLETQLRHFPMSITGDK